MGQLEATSVAFRDLRDFLSFVEQRGQLNRVRTGFTSELEITETPARVVKSGGPALFFEKVTGYSMPVVTNLLGTEQRMAWALGVDTLDGLGDKVRGLLKFVQEPLPSSMMDKLKVLGALAEISSYAPKSVSKGASQEVVLTDDASLKRLPVLKCWPLDGGLFITLPRGTAPATIYAATAPLPPVTVPGISLGSTRSGETASFPKKLVHLEVPANA